MTRALGWAAAAALGVVLLYLSPYWPFQWWGREGLFGVEALRPRGDVLARQFRGTQFTPFTTLIWAIVAILILTLAEWIAGRLRR